VLNSVNLALTGLVFVLFLTDSLRFQKQGISENTFSEGVSAYFWWTTVCILRQVHSGGIHFPCYCLDWSSGKGPRCCFAKLWSCFFAL